MFSTKSRYLTKTGKYAGGLVTLLFVSGCSGALSPIPMTSVSSEGVVLQGTLVPSMDFSGTFALASADGLVTCAGSTASSGQGTIQCNDGQSAVMSIPKPPYGQFNGSYVDRFPWGDVAVGWGTGADVAALTALLP